MFLTVSLSLLQSVTSWKAEPSLESLLRLLNSGQDWLKLPHHIRSRCIPSDGKPGHYIYVKGLEPLEDDYARLLASLGRRNYRGSDATFLQYFSHREEKVPAMLRLEEGVSEGHVGHHLQTQALAFMGKTLNVPSPIGLWKLTPEAKKQLTETLFAHLDEAGKQQCARVLQRDEAAVYAYEQGSLPHRLDDYLNPRTWSLVKASYSGEFVPSEAIEKWLFIFLFFLKADTLAFHTGAIGLGSPFDAGNLCLSGGVADLGTCLVGTKDLDPSYIRSSMKMACEGFLLVFGTLLKLNHEDTFNMLVQAVDKLTGESPVLQSELAREFRQSLCQELRCL